MSAEQINGERQITIPAHIREQLDLSPGTTIQLETIGNVLQVPKVFTGDRGSLIIQL
jgi:AbrB family looped-hinge helix DNA binding protein